MYHQLYAEAVDEAPKVARERERELLLRAVKKLAIAKTKGPASNESSKAMSFLRELWGAFIRDLSNDENALPLELRASLISIGLWMGREADIVDAGHSCNYDLLIEINQLIADGLA